MSRIEMPHGRTAGACRRAQLLEQLTRSVDEVIDCARRIEDTEALVSTAWSALDTLGHLVFWHESFARNVSDLARGATPTPLKGRYAELNQQCAEQMRGVPVEALLDRLAAAQSTIQRCILDPALPLIPYRRGSRDYAPDEHLEVVHHHLQHHLRQLRRADRRSEVHKPSRGTG